MRYIYFGHKKQEKHKGVICVGFEQSQHVFPAIKYSVALCSPKDNFSKKLARKIIDGRMKKGKYRTLHCDGEIETVGRLIEHKKIISSNKEIIEKIIEDYDYSLSHPAINGHLPRWAKSIRGLIAQ